MAHQVPRFLFIFLFYLAQGFLDNSELFMGFCLVERAILYGESLWIQYYVEAKI